MPQGRRHWAPALIRVGETCFGVVLLLSVGARASHIGERSNAALPLSPVMEVTSLVIEAVVGVALLFARWPRAAASAGIALFGLFTSVAVRSAWMRLSSCGCFGNAHLPPLVMIVLDASGVLFFSAALAYRNRHLIAASHQRRRLVASIGIAVLASGIGAGGDAWEGTKRSALPLLRPLAHARIKPEALRLYPELARGRWGIVYYRSECSHCRESMNEWASTARIDHEQSGRKWAFVAVDAKPSDNDPARPFAAEYLVCIASPDESASIPMVAGLNDGTFTGLYSTPDELIGASE